MPSDNKLELTVSFLREKLGTAPDLMVVLGSGLSNVLSNAELITSIPYSDIPGYARSTVSGHSGVLDLIRYEHKKIAVLRGRIHTYEGHSASDVVRTIRALAVLGVKKAVLTNAAGSTCLKHRPGSFVIIKDYLNMTGLTPLNSAEARTLGATFIDMSEPFCLKLIKEIKKIGAKLKIGLPEGVYAWMPGPQYETASEVRMLNKLGATVVGMSTVPEVIALKQLKVDILGISMVTNYGTGVKKGKKLSHEEVKAAGKKAGASLDNLLKQFIKKIS